MHHNTEPRHVTMGGILLIGVMLPLLSGGCGAQGPGTPMSYHELRQQGNVLQTHQYSCGAASLATLMSMLGEPATEEQLLGEVFEHDPKLQVVAREGEDEDVYLDPLTVRNLEELARNRGLQVVSLKALPAEAAVAAIESLEPIITRLTIHDELLHFVVVRRIDNGFVWIADPAYGNYRIPLRQFYQAWDGGGRIIVAVSRKPFLAWEDDQGQLYVKRDPSEPIDRAELADRFPQRAYGQARHTVTLMNSLSR